MGIPHNNLIQERQSIIAQATARGLQLSEDGRSWVPINPEFSQVMSVENEPSNYSVSSYVIASINGVILGITLVILFSLISTIVILTSLYILFFFISLLGGVTPDVSLVDFLFG